MKIRFLAVIAAAVVAAGCASSGSGPAGGVKGDQFEGCECDVYCPCVFSKDATADQCRAIVAWPATEGSFEGSSLAGLSWVGVITKSGKNIDKALGKLEGTMYLPQNATDAQRKAIGDLMTKEMGAAFAPGKMAVKVVPIEVKGSMGHYEVMVGQGGQIVTLKISPLKGSNGQVTAIDNAPSPLALPKEYCAKAEVHK